MRSGAGVPPDVTKSLWLLGFMVVLLCGVYPAALWAVGQVAFPFQANGSLLPGSDGAPVGSRLIAQPFTRDEYFRPRPSAAAYDGSASASSTLAPSNYLLRDRVARTLGPIVTYRTGPKRGQRVGPDVERWFRADRYDGAPHLVAQWADAHGGLARAWVTADSTHAAALDAWARKHPEAKATDTAVAFFEAFSREHPGEFPSADVQSIFFDMWRHDHPDADLDEVPGDLVTASGSGLDPHITLQNAEYQLDRVASAWARTTRRDPARVRAEIDGLLRSNAQAPLGGLVGEPLVNVLEVNLELRARYGAPTP